MNLFMSPLDWWIVGGFFALTVIIGLSAAKLAGKSLTEYFIGGRNMPWWLLGFSMVATTFSTDVPNLVTNLVREHGVFGNWSWFCFLPTGMLTVFLFAKLWRRSGTVTDLEFYELRYSGKQAAFLRGFRAVYLGLFFNSIVMASVNLAAIKIGASMLNLTPIQTIVGALVITCIFSAISGLRGVLLTDFVLFIASMVGSIGAAIYILDLPEVGGMAGMMEKLSATPELFRKTQLMGYCSITDLIAFFIVPFAIVWWSVWYPGAEPGGGGFIAQRMLAAKDEQHSVAATMFFNVAHYALRPWPWIIVALASLIVYPTRESLIAAVGNVLPEAQIQGDVAYSLMMTKLPRGLIGIVVASLAAAYVSTISTLLNWGASYLVNDFYKRFLRPTSSEREQVNVARLCTVLLMVISGVMSLFMKSAVANFGIILSIGAGTGLIFMLRWYWWRVNAASEIVAMIASFVFAQYFSLVHHRLFPSCELSASAIMVISVLGTTICWLIAAFFGPATDKQVLYKFVKKINPGGPGWKAVAAMAQRDNVTLEADGISSSNFGFGLLLSLAGCVMTYAMLFAIGDLLYGFYVKFGIEFAVFILSALFIAKYWKKSV